jgi:hypothetical protein
VIEDGANEVKTAVEAVGSNADETVRHVRDWAEPVLGQAEWWRVKGAEEDALASSLYWLAFRLSFLDIRLLQKAKRQ